MGARRLAVNADDFGYTRDVNAGIIEAHLRGILTATTLMANGDAFDDAVRLAGEVPSLDIGAHLVLVGGRSLLREGRALPESVGAMMRAVALGALDPYAELRAQMEKITAAGVRLTHLDTHKHTHLFPPVLGAVARLAEEFDVRWVRRPFDLDGAAAAGRAPWKKRMVSRGMRVMRGSMEKTLARHGCLWTDWFVGFQITGRFTAEDVVRLIEELPAGSTEFMVHPGLCGAELQGAKTRLKESRVAELEALTDGRVVEAVGRAGVELSGLGEL